MANKAMAKERRAIDRTEAALRADRKGDYKWATGNIDAIYAALGRTMNRSGRRLSARSRRIVSRMEELAARQKQQGIGAVRRAEGAAVNRYGGVMAGAARADFGVARATATGGADVAAAQAREGRGIASTGNELLKLARAGAREAEAGAQYGASQALSERANEDIALIAQQRHDLAMAKIQQQYALQAQEREFELYKKKLRFEQNLAEKQLGVDEGAALTGMTQSLSDGSSLIREALAEDPSLTPSEAVEQVADQLDITNPGDEAVYRSLATYLKNGEVFGENDSTRMDEVNAIMYAIRDNYRRYYGDHRKRLERLIKANLSAIYSAPATPVEPEAPSTGDPLSGYTDRFGLAAQR